MSNVKWIKLSTQMFEDEKIKLIEQMPEADTILIIWVKLLSQAGKANANGYIYLSENIPYTDEMLATIFNRPLNTVRMALETFKAFGMIEIDDEHFINISNWEKHQNVAGLERIREQNRIRKQRQRKKAKLAEPKKDSHVTVTQSHATEELELEEEIDKERDIKIKYVRDLFDHYVSKNIIRHQKLTEAMKRSISARLKDFSFEQLKQVIDNYASVYHSNDYWFTYKYSLSDLMREKDVMKFLDDSEPMKNFAKRKDENNAGNQRRNGSVAGASYEDVLAAAERDRKAWGG